MPRQTLREALAPVAWRQAPTRPASADDAARARVAAVLAAEFGIEPSRVLMSAECPALAWLRRVEDGTADSAEVELFDELSGVVFFDGALFETADYLRALGRRRLA